MARKTVAQLEQQIDDLLETNADLKSEYVQLREIYGDTLAELKQAQEDLAAAIGNNNIPNTEFPWGEGKPVVSSYKERMAIAKAQAMASGRAVLV